MITGKYGTRKELVESVFRCALVARMRDVDGARFCNITPSLFGSILKKQQCPLSVQIESAEAGLLRSHETGENPQDFIGRIEELKARATRSIYVNY